MSKKKQAQAFLDCLRKENMEVLSVDNINRSKSGTFDVDDMLIEAIESTDMRNEPKRWEEIDNAIELRLSQLGLAEEPSETKHRYEKWEHLIREQPEERSAEKHRKRINYKAIAAALVCVFAIGVATMQASYAFNWMLLKKFFAPIAEVFGLVTETSNIEDVGALKKSKLLDELQVALVDDPYSSVEHLYDSIENVPSHILQYPIMPKWIPDGYEFLYASEFANATVISAYAVFEKDDQRLFIKWYVLDERTTNDTLFEISNKTDSDVFISDRNVTLYKNNDILSATWVEDMAYYSVWGEVTKEEIVSIIESI